MARPTRIAFRIQSQDPPSDEELQEKITTFLYALKPLELTKICWIRDSEGVMVYLRSRKQVAISTPRNVGWKGYVEPAFKEFNVAIADDEVIALSSKFEALMRSNFPFVEFKVTPKASFLYNLQ
jgi:hypothetical protein